MPCILQVSLKRQPSAVVREDRQQVGRQLSQRQLSKLQEEWDKEIPQVPLYRVMLLNLPEWWLIFLGEQSPCTHTHSHTHTHTHTHTHGGCVVWEGGGTHMHTCTHTHTPNSVYCSDEFRGLLGSYTISLIKSRVLLTLGTHAH